MPSGRPANTVEKLQTKIEARKATLGDPTPPTPTTTPSNYTISSTESAATTKGVALPLIALFTFFL